MTEPLNTDIQVVESSNRHGNFAPRQIVAILVTALVVVVGAYSLWSSGSDGQRNVSPFEPGIETTVTDATVPTTVESTTSSTTSPATTSTSTTILSTTPTSAGGMPNEDPNENSPEFCSWLIPNLVGKTMWETGGPLMGCINQHLFGLGPTVSFEIYTTSEPCTTDPALYDRIGSQSPSPGTPFGGGTIRINVSFYRNCSIPTTTVPPPTIPVPPSTESPPSTEPPPFIPGPSTP